MKEFGKSVTALVAKGNAVIEDIAAIRHLVPICNVMGVQKHEGFIAQCQMVLLVTAPTLSVLAGTAAHRAPIAIPFKDGHSERGTDLFLAIHSTRA
ncbi:MAG TPA: hypothetical protein VHR66_23325 [Gemmataceae bacterium]|jgi:hypothetical protein|nr:hypothetical protein [Gemmataceae bacterium]